MSIDKYNKIFMVGIGGAGMRGLGLLLKERGLIVKGTDKDYISLKKQPAMREFELVPENEAAASIERVDLVIYSDAIVKNHPLRSYSDRINTPTLSYQNALGLLAENYKVIAVTGTHGKSSTTALLSHILITCGLDPSVLIGAGMPELNGQNARAGKGEYLILEADEYREHFLTLSPFHAIITTIDFDHPDYYFDLNHVKSAYGRFIAKIDPKGRLVVPKHFINDYPDIKWPKNTLYPDNSINLKDIKLALPGKHMLSNAALALTLAKELQIDPDEAAHSLESFAGLSRRFEVLGRLENMKIISDYGHHPEEIDATVRAAFEKFPEDQIAVVVEIHMPERLTTFFKEYLNVLQKCQTVLFTPVFKPKGRKNTHDNSKPLLSKLEGMLEKEGVNVFSIDNYDNLEPALRKLSPEFNTAICFSAGILDSKLREIIK